MPTNLVLDCGYVHGSDSIMNMNGQSPPRSDGSDPDLESWQQSAAKWIEQGDRIAEVTGEATTLLIEALDPQPGERFLDVASGVGDPAFSLADRVGPHGRVVATDAVAAMAEALRSRVAARGLADRVEVHHVAVQELSFPPDSFDGASCRFGVMFFPDPADACRRLARSVRAGGRMALLAWGPKQGNPYFTCAMGALDDVGAPELGPVPGSHGVFEFGEPGQLASVCRAAGWREVDDRLVDLRLWVEAEPAGLLEAQARISDRVRERCDGLTPATRARAAGRLAKQAEVWAREGHIAFPAQVHLVTGRPWQACT